MVLGSSASSLYAYSDTRAIYAGGLFRRFARSDELFGLVISFNPADYRDQRFGVFGDSLKDFACFDRLFRFAGGLRNAGDPVSPSCSSETVHNMLQGE